MSRIPLQALIQVGVVDCFGMQLLFNPFFQTELADFFDVSGTWTVRETIHGVQNGFVFGEFGDGKFAFESLVEGDVFGGARRAALHVGLGAGMGVICGARRAGPQ